MAEENKIDLNLKNKVITPKLSEIKISPEVKLDNKYEKVIDGLLIKFNELSKKYFPKYQEFQQKLQQKLQQQVSNKIPADLLKKPDLNQTKALLQNRTSGLLAAAKTKIRQIKAETILKFQKIKENILGKLSKPQ